MQTAVNIGLLNEPIENSFYTIIKENKIDALLNDYHYEDAINELVHISKSIMNFFNQVNINTEDENITRNRKNLVKEVRDLFNKVADFSKLEG